jgi:hypothetical protein
LDWIRLAAILAAEWRAYFRRVFRGGTSAKSNLLVLAVIALLAAGRYIKFLRQAEGPQLQILFVAIFFVIASSLRNDGPLTSAALQRFPLTSMERRAIQVFSALVPPYSWLVMIFSCGVFWPLSKLGAVPVLGGIALIIGGVTASQIPIPVPRLQLRSRTMTMFRKEIRYILSLPEHALILLITLAFCIYLIGGEGLQADALRAVFGILSVLSVSFPMNAFGLDGGAGLDRYGLSPVTGSYIVGTKNLAFFSLVAIQRLPILALALWRFGAAEALWAVVETASLTLLVLAWGNIVSVRHPTGPDMEPTVLDGLVGTASALLPCAATIVILRSGASVALQMFGLLAICGLFYYGSLRFSGPHFARNFDRVRALLVG